MANETHRVVIIGGGFGGLNAARALRRVPVHVTLLDRRNFHLFQPLLYQVATGGLSPANIAAPLRGILSRQRNTTVFLADVVDIDVERRAVLLIEGDEVPYDTLVIATGSSHHYFGHEEWAPLAPGLKTIEDAIEIRRRVLLAFEAAEREPDAATRRGWLTFVVVGGGPTGVELAGALGEIANDTLRHDFRSIDPAQAEIVLLEATERVLPPYPPDLSAKAERSLRRLGVTVRTGATVTAIQPGYVAIRSAGQDESIAAQTVLWAAGVQASPLGRRLAERTGVEVDRAGRLVVEPDLTLAGHPEIFVIGDLALCKSERGQPLPALAPVAMQEGRYVARVIAARLRGKTVGPFRYRHRGNMATIGRAAAVAELGRLHIAGYPGWLAWLFVHLLYLVGYQNRLLVLLQWAWNYVTRNRAARLITGPTPFPLRRR
jgi:NADH:ubiquinone reductase (H+-translocating)